MNSDDVERRRMDRLRLLETLYEHATATPVRWVEALPVAAKLGISQSEALNAVLYYQDHGFIERFGLTPVVAFTAKGIDHMEDIILKRDAQRLRILREVYKLTDGNTGLALDDEDLNKCADAAGLSKADADLAFQWLENNGLMAAETMHHVSITPQGVEEAEASFRHPEDATDHFGAKVVNVTNNYSISGNVGALQSGSGNTATIVQNNAYGDRVIDAFSQLRRAAQRLDGEEREEAEALIDGMEEQVKSAKPNKAMVKTAAQSLKDKIKFKEIDVVSLLSLVMNAVHAASAAGL
ncbi:MAG: hypothetical protein U0441_16870 [Polyangiaceae bacterium]